MALLNMGKIQILLLVMFAIGHRRSEANVLSNDILSSEKLISILDTDHSVEFDSDGTPGDSVVLDLSSIQSVMDLSSIQSVLVDLEDPSYVPSDDEMLTTDSSSSVDYNESEDPNFVSSDVELTSNSSTSTDYYNSEDPSYVPSDDELLTDSSSSVDYKGSEDPSYVPSDAELTSNSSSSVDYNDPEDPSYVPSDDDVMTDSSSSVDYKGSEDPSYVPSDAEMTSNSSSSVEYPEDPSYIMSEDELLADSSSSIDYYKSEDPSFLPSDDALMHDYSSTTLSDDYDSKDPSFIPSDDDTSSTSSTSSSAGGHFDFILGETPKPVRVSSRKHPAVSSNHPEKGDSGSDHNNKRKGNVARKDMGEMDTGDKTNPKPTRGGGKTLQENSKDKSKRPAKQWRGAPSPQRLKEIRKADTKYLDLYLCGQFLDVSADGSNDFAVMGFNYAGRAQPFLPCRDPLSTTETVNYLYRSRTDNINAFHQIVQDLPATWQKYEAEKGAAPRIVHIFTFNMPTDVTRFIQLRNSAPYNSARFVLGYVNQQLRSGSEDHTTSEVDQDINMLDEFKKAHIDAVRVCGRCVKTASYPVGGRRRKAMQYGMSDLALAATNSQCPTVQEVEIPGASFFNEACDGFQNSIAKCTVRAIDRRCPGVDTVAIFAGPGTEEALLRTLNAITRVCVRDRRCWRTESHSLSDFFTTNSNILDGCTMPKVAFGKILERCAAAAIELPLDIL